MKRARRVLMMSVLVAISVAVMFSLSYADGRVTGRSAHFTPDRVRVGEIMKISVRFTVTGGPVNLTATVKQTTPRHEGFPPTLLGTFNPGDHIVDVYRYTVPTSPPETICFDIKITGGEFRNVCLFGRREAKGWYMNVKSHGQWVEVAPGVPEMPDLMVDISGSGLGHLPDLYPDNPGMGPDRFFVRGMVFNGGRVAVPAGRCEVDIFLSKDSKVSPGDRLMGRIVITEAIPPFEPGRYGSVLIPRREYSIIGIPAGIYYICARVDPRNRIGESNEINNDNCYHSAIRIHKAGSAR